MGKVAFSSTKEDFGFGGGALVGQVHDASTCFVLDTASPLHKVGYRVGVRPFFTYPISWIHLFICGLTVIAVRR